MGQTPEQIRALRKKMQQMYPPVYSGQMVSPDSTAIDRSAASSRVERPLSVHMTTLQDKVGMDDEEARRLMDEGVARTNSVEASAAEIEQLLRQKLKQKMAQRNATAQSLPTGIL